MWEDRFSRICREYIFDFVLPYLIGYSGLLAIPTWLNHQRKFLLFGSLIMRLPSKIRPEGVSSNFKFFRLVILLEDFISFWNTGIIFTLTVASYLFLYSWGHHILKKVRQLSQAYNAPGASSTLNFLGWVLSFRVVLNEIPSTTNMKRLRNRVKHYKKLFFSEQQTKQDQITYLNMSFLFPLKNIH